VAGILIHHLLVVTLLILSVWAKKMMARDIEEAPVIFEFLVKPDRTGRYPQQLAEHFGDVSIVGRRTAI
jgi:hypothetical protein